MPAGINAPDPATVDEATGVVKYELGQIVTYREDTGEPWDGTSYVPHIRTRAGSTIMGDGRVALILDVDGIARHAGVFAHTLRPTSLPIAAASTGNAVSATF